MVPTPTTRESYKLALLLLLDPFFAPKEDVGGSIPSLAIWAQDLFLST